jgi:hypothetical protein
VSCIRTHIGRPSIQRRSMNGRIRMVTWGAAMMLFCTCARAQDANRIRGASQDATAVDLSIHARLGEPGTQAEPSLESGKPRPSYSQWAFRPAKSSATQFGPASQTVPAAAVTAVRRPADGFTRRQLFRIVIRPVPPEPQAKGLSKPFPKEKLGLPNASSFPNPFSQASFRSRRWNTE